MENVAIATSDMRAQHGAAVIVLATAALSSWAAHRHKTKWGREGEGVGVIAKRYAFPQPTSTALL
jgi:hypothetical protein